MSPDMVKCPGGQNHHWVRGSGHSSDGKLVAPFSAILVKTYNKTKLECTEE